MIRICSNVAAYKEHSGRRGGRRVLFPGIAALGLKLNRFECLRAASFYAGHGDFRDFRSGREIEMLKSKVGYASY